MSKEQEPHHNCETIGEQLAHAAGYQKARSKDTDLIKDMLPYMQHDKDCKRWGLDRSTPYPHDIIETCTCGLSEVLQRINERSK